MSAKTKKATLAFDGLVATINLLKLHQATAELSSDLDGLAGLAGSLLKEYRSWWRASAERRGDLQQLMRIHSENLVLRARQVAGSVSHRAQWLSESDAYRADEVSRLSQILEWQALLLCDNLTVAARFSRPAHALACGSPTPCHQGVGAELESTHKSCHWIA